jgi:hypothetical protein
MKALMAVAVFLAGCANSSQTYTADGRMGHSINCSGTARNWGMCEQKAGELCGARGYEILSTAGDRGVIATAGNGNFFATSTISRTMLVSCKPAAAGS